MIDHVTSSASFGFARKTTVGRSADFEWCLTGVKARRYPPSRRLERACEPEPRKRSIVSECDAPRVAMLQVGMIRLKQWMTLRGDREFARSGPLTAPAT